MSSALHFQKLICTKLSSNFREATQIVQETLPPLAPTQVLVKNAFLGINASDINFTNGKYLPGVKPPFDVGFEAIGTVVDKGTEVKGISKADPVLYTKYGAFSEFAAVEYKTCFRLPSLSPKYLTIPVSGLTASLALEKVGEMKSGETVLVTAAAGATGLFAVQLAKQAGNHVIGTVSSDSKAGILKSFGCDRVINYKKENLREVLQKEYPKGINLVYESVGGDIFDTCVDNLARHGRLIVIGAISGYQDGSSWKETQRPKTPLPFKILPKSASIRGFFLNDFQSSIPQHFQNLVQLEAQKKLKFIVDDGKEFMGLKGVSDALDYMYASSNIGKVYVKLPQNEQSKL